MASPFNFVEGFAVSKFLIVYRFDVVYCCLGLAVLQSHRLTVGQSCRHMDWSSV